MPGGYAAPKNLGAGTVVNSVSLSSPSALPGTTANTIVVAPNSSFTVGGTVGREPDLPNQPAYCPGCIRQLYIGIGGIGPDGPPFSTAWCVASGVLPAAPSGYGWNHTFQAPSEPGVYYIRATTSLQYFCVGAPVGGPEASIARVIVRAPVGMTLDLWSPPVSPATLWEPATNLEAVAEVSSGGTILLRARPDPAIPSGRVSFETTAPAIAGSPSTGLLIQPGSATSELPDGNPNLAVDVCPTSGLLRGVACIPGEARLIAQAAPSAQGRPLTVTARLVDGTLELPHPVNATGTETYAIRFALTPAPGPSTKPLTVLVASATTLRVYVAGTLQNSAADVPICATPPDPETGGPAGCTELKLSASVAAQATPSTLAPTCDTDANTATPACSVVFERAEGTVWQNGSCTSTPGSSWEVLGTVAEVPAGAADFFVQPGFGTTPPTMGCFVFRARFERGGSNFEPSTSATSNTVTFTKAQATVAWPLKPDSTCNGLSPVGAKVGEALTFTATLTGSNGFTTGASDKVLFKYASLTRVLRMPRPLRVKVLTMQAPGYGP